jgi:predicted Zn-dependent protease
VEGQIAPGEAFEKGHAAAMHALELDGTLPEAHHAMAAYYLFHAWDWQRAEEESKRAIGLNPNYAEFHHLYSYILFAQNRDQEAFEEQRRAMELDSFSRPWALGTAYTHRRQYDAAIAELRARASSHMRNFELQVDLARAFWLNGMQRDAVEQMEQGYLIIGDKTSADGISRAYSAGGDEGAAKWTLNRDQQKARSRYVSPYMLAIDYARAGQKEEAVKQLEMAVKERSPSLIFLQKTPEFDFLHSDPRYRAVVGMVGLPPAF